jgi:uncharacterized delta-60 repeat protein
MRAWESPIEMPFLSCHARGAVVEPLERRVLLHAGDLDPTFGVGGRVLGPQPPDLPSAIQIGGIIQQPDQKIVIAGVESGRSSAGPSLLDVRRYLATGVLDPCFGINGEVTIRQPQAQPAAATGLALTADGKIIVGGTADIYRLNSNGSLDTTFGTQGQVSFGNLEVSSLAEQQDGKLVVASSGADLNNPNVALKPAVLTRLNANGTVDDSFGTNSRVNTPRSGNEFATLVDLSIAPDGKIITLDRTATPAAAATPVLHRFAPGGALDKSFGGTGTVQSPVGNPATLAVQPNGEIVIAGGFPSNFGFGGLLLARLHVDGTFDRPFFKNTTNSYLESRNATPRAVTVASDGTIIVVATTATDTGGAAALVAGFDPDGTIETIFGSSKFGLPDPTYDPFAVFAAPEAGFFVAGVKTVFSNVTVNDFTIVAYTSEGLSSGDFGSGGASESIAVPPQNFSAVAVQGDGKIIAAGDAVEGSFNETCLIRYNADGSIDTSFGANGFDHVLIGGAESQLAALSVQADGKIVVAVEAFSSDPQYVPTGIVVARLNASGLLDPTFGGDGQAFVDPNGSLAQLFPLQGGKLLVCTADGLFRLNPDGSVDQDFHGSSDVGSNAFAMQTNGYIIAADTADDLLHRYRADGTPDTAFGTGGTLALAALGLLDIASMTIIGNGDIAFVGTSLAGPATIPESTLFAITPNGSGLDASFGSNGLVFIGSDFGALATTGPGGNLLVAETEVLGSFDNQVFSIKRFTPDGRLDATFGQGGVDRLSFGDVDPTNIPPTPFALAVDSARNRLVAAVTVAMPTLTAVTLAGTGGSITGTVFDDHSGDGVRQSNEPPLANRFVYIDYNNDGKFDGPDKSVLTDASGRFVFSDLPPGTYHVRHAPAFGWISTSAAVFTVTVAVGKTSGGVSFGDRQLAAVSGVVFDDLNGNGVTDAGESGLAGWSVYVDLNNDGRIDAGDRWGGVADASGHFVYLRVPPGTYHVIVVPPKGWKVTTPVSMLVKLREGQTASVAFGARS